MIDKEQIEQIEGMPIEDVAMRLGLHVERHKCLCPFHDDSHPSLTFNTYRNRYRCYVCDAHGGVIDLVMRYRHLSFPDAVRYLNPSEGSTQKGLTPKCAQRDSTGGLTLSCSPSASSFPRKTYPPDIAWLSTLLRNRVLNDEAKHFLYEDRKIDPRVVAWCGITSISTPTPCWRYGKPFYDAPSLLIPYYDINGRLLSVQSRYLGRDEKPRFKFPRGSNCHIYNLPILRLLKPNEPLWITEGCSDCWAMLSAGHKAIAIPSATLLKPADLKPLSTLNSQLSTTFHMYPDQDQPGEKLFMELFERLPQLERHQLPAGCKDFGDYWKQCQKKILT